MAAYKARWYQDHREEVSQQHAQWYIDHAEERRQYMVQYYQEHRDEQNAYGAQYRQEHREEKAQYGAQWKKNNPDKVRAYCHRRRAIKMAVDGKYTAADIQRQGDSQGWKCWWRAPGCLINCKDNYHVDHLVPLSRGGHNNPSNLVISCPTCNLKKHAKTPDEFAGRLF
jgi:5-methylcytosine-specific restriction endonuclease McrA